MIDAQKIYFVGIGGIGTSALAQILNARGVEVSGSDNVPSDITKALKKQKITVFDEHNDKNLDPKTDLVVYSPAIPYTNPELKKAKKLKIPTLTYPQALGELTKDYFTIAVAGTHGKSTTTAMTAIILEQAGLDPNVVIGTKIHEFNNQNYRVGDSDILLIEACEYKRSFHNFHPNILAITNIEADHLDVFKDLEDYKKAFEKLAKQTSTAVIINGDEKNSKDITKTTKATVVLISEKQKKANFHLDKNKFSYDANKIKLTPKVIGNYNVKNATFAAAISALFNVPPKTIEKSIKAFKGSWRRMEEKTKMGKTRIIDDYAHHPTEITAALGAIREANKKAKILCVYQPHQYNRTKHFLKGFGKSFSAVDEVIIPDIYKVRDSKKDLESVSTDDLVKEISKHHKNVSNGNGLRETAKFIKKNHANYDIIVTMGAGNIDGIYKWL